MKPIVGVFGVAAVATVGGDAIWYTYGVAHSTVAGLVHRALLLTAVGAVLGAASGRVLKGLPIGALAGIGGAASYYLLVAVMEHSLGPSTCWWPQLRHAVLRVGVRLGARAVRADYAS
jgi:hypothetical protein